MTEENKCYAYFTVVGDFDPKFITECVGVSPSDAWGRGDLHPRTGAERKFSRWSLRSRLEDKRPLEAHVSDVLDQLDANPTAFKEVSVRQGGGMQLVAYFHTFYPGVHFEQAVVQRLANYGLSVDCDFYYLYSDVREDTE
jgi:hypothetical protein